MHPASEADSLWTRHNTISNLFRDYFLLFTNSSCLYPLEMYKALLNMLLGTDPTAIKVPFTSLLTTSQWGKIPTCLTGSRARSRIKDADDERALIKGASRAEGEEARSRLLRSCLPRSFLPALGDSLHAGMKHMRQHFPCSKTMWHPDPNLNP